MDDHRFDWSTAASHVRSRVARRVRQVRWADYRAQLVMESWARKVQSRLGVGPTATEMRAQAVRLERMTEAEWEQVMRRLRRPRPPAAR
jgi:hypothetical protein